MDIEDLNKGGFLIARIHQIAQRIFSQKLAELDSIDINSTQSRAIHILWQQDMIPLQTLRNRLSLSKSTTSELVQKLEQQGFVAKIPCQEDKRKTLIRLNREKIPLKKDFFKTIEEMETILYNGIDQATINFFESILDKILENLTQYHEKTQF
jgi:DNA-binding MarR family transcriptional regulator